MANLPGSFAQSQASYGLLSDLNYLSVNYGTYKTFVEKYPALARSNYILGAEAAGAGDGRGPQAIGRDISEEAGGRLDIGIRDVPGSGRI